MSQVNNKAEKILLYPLFSSVNSTQFTYQLHAIIVHAIIFIQFLTETV